METGSNDVTTNTPETISKRYLFNIDPTGNQTETSETSSGTWTQVCKPHDQGGRQKYIFAEIK